jgi:Mg2+-importing ATPase
MEIGKIMPALPTPVLPKQIPHEPHTSAIQVSPILLEAGGREPEEVLHTLHTSKDGISPSRPRPSRPPRPAAAARRGRAPPPRLPRRHRPAPGRLLPPHALIRAIVVVWFYV